MKSFDSYIFFLTIPVLLIQGNQSATIVELANSKTELKFQDFFRRGGH